MPLLPTPPSSSRSISKNLGHVGVGTTNASSNFQVGANPYDNVSLGVGISSVGNINASGIITATSFAGDGSALTGITQTTINNNANNLLITGSGTANTLEAESQLTYDGTNLQLKQTTAAYNDIIFDAAQTAADQSLGLLSGYWDGNREASK